MFDFGKAYEFNRELEAGNPLSYEGFDLKLEEAKAKTGLGSSCITWPRTPAVGHWRWATLIDSSRDGPQQTDTWQ